MQAQDSTYQIIASDRLKAMSINELKIKRDSCTNKDDLDNALVIQNEITARESSLASLDNAIANPNKPYSEYTEVELIKKRDELTAKDDFVGALDIQDELNRRLTASILSGKPNTNIKINTDLSVNAKPLQTNNNLNVASTDVSVKEGTAGEKVNESDLDGLILNDDMRLGIKKREAEMLPMPDPTIYPDVSLFVISSYGIYKQVYIIESVLQFLRIEQREVQDPQLGTVTEVVCYDAYGNLMPCNKIDKAERERISKESSRILTKIIANATIATASALLIGKSTIGGGTAGYVKGALSAKAVFNTTKILNKALEIGKQAQRNLEESNKCLALLKE